MFVNSLLLFFIPWIFGAYLLKSHKELLISFGPISSLIAFIFNELGTHFGWWSFRPEGFEFISIFISNIGIYLVVPCLMIHFIRKNKLSHSRAVILFSLFLTLLEFIMLKMERIHYDQGWNIGWTLVSYLLSNTFIAVYFWIWKKAQIT
ncbi:CBO0543 family protein [Paenibacillus timonensis]|uniref:CBO0543 family protein n=1 Tax=Paenibacillus timonensis TaxID=225915 RepID=UPI003F9E8D39